MNPFEITKKSTSKLTIRVEVTIECGKKLQRLLDNVLPPN